MALISKCRGWSLLTLALGLALLSGCQADEKEPALIQSSAEADSGSIDGAALVAQRCAACHANPANGARNRIEQIRKTPEGWFMTVVRMEREGRVALDQDQRRAIVKYLSDTQGLAPAETAGFRYALEKRPNTIESPADPELAVMCGRCHSNARYSLQRRDIDEWQKLVNFHVVQFPTLEYQAMSADRRWFEEAVSEYANLLASSFPYDTAAWTAWQAKQSEADLSGQWRIVGHEPGKGSYQGKATITRGEGDNYEGDYALSYRNGETWKGKSEALLYTGYEWRGRSERDDSVLREVYWLSEDGSRLAGRWFDIDRDEMGGDWMALRVDADSSVLAVEPPHLKTGDTQEVSLYGVGLEGELDFGPGVEVSVSRRSDTEILATVKTSADAEPGLRQIQVGAAIFGGPFVVYERIDTVRIEPENAVARVGAGGGKLHPVPAQFEAVGYTHGKDGEPNTEDDIRLGIFPAQWSHDNYDELSTELEDARFTGSIDERGLFHPADAGINPDRYIETNNMGVLAITGAVSDGEREVSGSARLVVTVQRFINPPIN